MGARQSNISASSTNLPPTGSQPSVVTSTTTTSSSSSTSVTNNRRSSSQSNSRVPHSHAHNQHHSPRGRQASSSSTVGFFGSHLLGAGQSSESSGSDFISGSSRDRRQSLASLSEELNPFNRILTAQSLPVQLLPFAFNDFKCPICSKTVPPDDADCHLVMCITKPHISYNEDVLTDTKGECVICLEDLEKGNLIARLPCLCIYHKKCIDAWFEVNRSCPEHPSD